MQSLYTISLAWLIPFAGRFHPLVVHLPIGLLLIAYIMEIVGRKSESKRHLLKSVPFVLSVGIFSGAMAALTGYLLSLGGGYGQEAVSLHQWMGISTLVLSIVTYLSRKGRHYFSVFTLSILAVVITGHLGGNLTHGPDYLTEHLPEALGGNGNTEISRPDFEEASMFPDIISPILRDKCQSCHNAAKMKGELRMDSYELLLKGGENGAIVSSGDAKSSEMIRRVHLPEDHEDTMPPEGKKRLTKDEIELLEFWIDSGLANNDRLSDLSLNDRLEGIIRGRLAPDTEMANPVFDKNISFASDQAIEELKAQGFSIVPIAAGSPFLQVSYFDRLSTLSKEKTDLLKSIARQIVWLDLSGINIADWSFLSDHTNLVRLHLKSTAIGDNQLDYLKAENLEYLNLYETQISKAALDKIEELKQLKSLYIGKTQLTQSDLITVKVANPSLYIDLGGKEATLMTDVKLARPNHQLTSPFIDQSTQLRLTSLIAGVKFHYTTDGSEPDENSSIMKNNQLLIDQTTEVKVMAAKEGWKPSDILTIPVFFKAKAMRVTSVSPAASPKYAGEGDVSLSDRKLGTESFDDGSWLGFEGTGSTITLELDSPAPLNKISVNFLDDNDRWIFLPKRVEVLVSIDGKNFDSLANYNIRPRGKPSDLSPELITLELQKTEAKYVRVEIEGQGKCPSWHPGKGQKAWLFINEIIVE